MRGLWGPFYKDTNDSSTSRLLIPSPLGVRISAHTFRWGDIHIQITVTWNKENPRNGQSQMTDKQIWISKKWKNLGLSSLLPHPLPPPPITLASPAPQLSWLLFLWVAPEMPPGHPLSSTDGLDLLTGPGGTLLVSQNPRPLACFHVHKSLLHSGIHLPAQAISRLQGRTWLMAAETAYFFAQKHRPAVTLTLAQTEGQFLL